MHPTTLRSCTILLVFLALIGLAGGRSWGEPVDGVVGPPVSVSQTTKPTERSSEVASLHLSISPSDAAVYLDGEFVARGDTVLTDLEPGSYRLEVRRRGYYDESRRITLSAGEERRLEISLDPITGFLDLDATPDDAEVVVGDRVLDTFPTELPIGVYDVTVRRFGYRGEQYRIVIGENQVTQVRAELKEAPFEASDLTVSKRRFNPLNIGPAGDVSISFRVTSYGTATVTIRDTEGAVVERRELPRFEHWEQRFRWSGRDADGTALPDGRYTVTVEAREEARRDGATVGGAASDGAATDGATADGEANGSDATGGEAAFELLDTVVIDRSVTSRHRSLLTGSAGLLRTPMAEVLGPGALQVSSEAYLYRDTANTWFAPIVVGVRYGLAHDVEVAGTLGPSISSSPQLSRFSASVAGTWRWLFLHDRTAAAVMVRGMFHSPTDGSFSGRDDRASFVGVGAALPVTLYRGAVHVSLAPELVLSPGRVAAETASDRVSTLVYVRGGVGVDLLDVSLSASAALRTDDFSAPSRDFAVDGGAQVEIHPRRHAFAVAIQGIVTGTTDRVVIGGGVRFSLLQ